MKEQQINGPHGPCKERACRVGNVLFLVRFSFSVTSYHLVIYTTRIDIVFKWLFYGSRGVKRRGENPENGKCNPRAKSGDAPMTSHRSGMAQ